MREAILKRGSVVSTRLQPPCRSATSRWSGAIRQHTYHFKRKDGCCWNSTSGIAPDEQARIELLVGRGACATSDGLSDRAAYVQGRRLVQQRSRRGGARSRGCAP